MRTEVEIGMLCIAAIIALLSAQLIMFYLLLSFAFVWEDAKWPAFVSSILLFLHMGMQGEKRDSDSKGMWPL